MDKKGYKNIAIKIQRLITRNNLNLLAEDYLNQAWLNLFDKQSEITHESIYRQARTLILGEKDRIPIYTKETTKVCRKCKNDFPVSFFYVSFRKDLNRFVVSCYCKDCERQKAKAYPRKKARANAKRAADALTDGYIKKNLRCCGIKNNAITKTMIDRRRNQILKKRKQKNTYPKNLNDRYIRKVLMTCGYRYKDITQDDITRRRKQIVKKRLLKKFGSKKPERIA